MSLASSRTAAALVAFALLAACGGKSKSPAASSALELACSVSYSGPIPVLTVIGRARTGAGSGAPPITVTMQVQPAPKTFTLNAPGWIGSAEFRGLSVRPGQVVLGDAVVDGVPATASCAGATGLPMADAHAMPAAGGAGADLVWSAVGGAVIYRWAVLDGPVGAVLDSGSTTGLSARSTVALTDRSVVEVGAYAITGAETSFPSPLPSPMASFARVVPTAGSTFGDGAAAWQLFGPGDYVGGTLTVKYPALAATERLAVLLVNAGGDDQGLASVSAVGTGDPNLSLAPFAPPLAMAAGAGAGGSVPGARDSIDRSGVMSGEALVSAWREETVARLRDGRLRRAPRASPPGAPLAATAAAAPMPATRFFCQGQLVGTAFNQLWKSATLAHETAHAAFYYTDEVQPGIAAALSARSDFFTSIGNAYESRILTALNTYFGPESDVDGNGKVIFLFANLGKSGGSFPVGYFWPGDIELPQASVLTCPRNTTGNRADMLYLLDPGNFTTNWDPTGANYSAVLNLIVDGEYPSTMAHELQHNVNYNTRFPQNAPAGVDEALWLNEGLSMLSETVSGYGLHTATGRSNVRNYQGTNTSSGLPYYQGFGMTIWLPQGGDPYGNYAGAQAYMQYLLDHASPAMTRALENQWLTGKANIENATGVPWELGFARFTTAAMFSNEDASSYAGGVVTSAGNLLAAARFNYVGDGASPDYVPWHHYTGACSGTPKARDANVAFTPLVSTASATLRQDGWAAFATGPGTSGAATVTVQSAASVRPHVVVVKYSGKLPNYVQPSCP